MRPQVQPFRHESSGTFSYIVYGSDNAAAAVIDPVLDYDPVAGRTTTESATQLIEFARDRQLQIEWILETHAHADHLSAAPFIKQELGGRIAIGEGIRKVQDTFSSVFNFKHLNTSEIQFDHLFSDGEKFRIGELEASVIATPGHTSDSVSYLAGDAVFVGDTLFAPDQGTARTDFPGGDAKLLYQSIQRLLELPDQTRVFLCHDYPAAQREAQYVHTVLDHRQKNVHVGENINEAAFVDIRTTRDATLAMPELIIPAVQVNIQAGYLPPAEDNGVSYLKVPVNQLPLKQAGVKS